MLPPELMSGLQATPAEPRQDCQLTVQSKGHVLDGIMVLHTSQQGTLGHQPAHYVQLFHSPLIYPNISQVRQIKNSETLSLPQTKLDPSNRP